jgi:hypothetical protein
MKSTDKFLVIIVLAVTALIVVAFAVALAQPEPSYQPEESAEAVVHNYLLALQRQEYARAYGYLSPDLSGYPSSLERFRSDIEFDWRFQLGGNPTIAVLSSRASEEQTTVEARVTRFYSEGLFSSSQSSPEWGVEARRRRGLFLERLLERSY